MWIAALFVTMGAPTSRKYRSIVLWHGNSGEKIEQHYRPLLLSALENKKSREPLLPAQSQRCGLANFLADGLPLREQVEVIRSTRLRVCA
jgi:hypothetical protein